MGSCTRRSQYGVELFYVLLANPIHNERRDVSKEEDRYRCHSHDRVSVSFLPCQFFNCFVPSRLTLNYFSVCVASTIGLAYRVKALEGPDFSWNTGIASTVA